VEPCATAKEPPLAKSNHPDRESALRLIAQHSLPELAAVLRSQSENIIESWMVVVRSVVPATTNLPSIELRDNLPAILAKMADVMESANRHDIDELVRTSPAQGLARFQQKYDIRDLMTEDRLLRRVIIGEVEIALGRGMNHAEQITLHMSIDIMQQEAVVAFIAQQNDKLRTAAEAELKYLSFLSHDMNNNLGSVTLLLQVLRKRLASNGDFEPDVQILDSAQKSILDTIGGMGRLLQSERLRKSGAPPQRGPVPLARLVSNVAQNFVKMAGDKSVKIAVEVPADVVLNSDGDLLGLILQNVVGNAVKYSTRGTVRVWALRKQDECVVSVSDEGPGIAVEHLDRIFDSFTRGEVHAQPGVGLGLTIASQAATLLNGKLAVESKIGVGSTFTLTLPTG
jgi:signal transduction histidine kinase